MDELKINREKIMNRIAKLNSKIFALQNELLNIEQLIVDSDHKEIMDALTLNDQQLKVINSKDLYTLVIACPGSGKTHTLISMYIKMIVEDKIDPANVLMITFTKKAGQEMCGRLSSLIPTKLPAYVGSLHGLSYRILQEYHNINYTVLDDKESKDILKDLCSEYLDIDDNEQAIVKMKIAYVIDKASSSYPFELNSTLKKLNIDNQVIVDKFQLIYDKYKEKKKNENLVDFNDLMLMFCEFLDTKESDTFKKKVDFIFFDEYQDVNPIQHYILNKLKKSRIMVVGDDAQAIYAFRGSSVDFILKFPKEFKPTKMYLLENNYRSTKQIVNFFQDIIKKNTNQYEKNVISVNPNEGLKPTIIGFKNQKDKEQWIINDLFENKNKGIPLSKMVILARTNDSLDKIEIELVKQGITVIKHTGLSILDKPHVKDFLAFLTVLVNEKSSIHWKRIFSLQLGVNQAHEIISNCNTTFLELIKKFKDTQVPYSNYFKELDCLFNLLCSKGITQNLKDVDKGRYILSYLEKMWAFKNKLEEKVKDINLLLSYLSGTNLRQFLSDLYLNQSIEANLDNAIYLTTIHGSKGLEWENVYLIDVDSDNFPKINHGFFKNECAEIEEERRLFYVACSRAKNNLIITYNYNLNPADCLNMSPFVREVDTELYNHMGHFIKNPYQMNGIISYDVNNYLKYFGFSKIYPLLKDLEYERTNIHYGFEIPKYLDKYKYSRIVINNFMDLLIAKMIQINFTKKLKNFGVTILEKIPQKIRQNYIDELSDWRNLLDDIFFISTFNIKDEGEIFNELKILLINPKMNDYYNNLINGLTGYIKKFKPKELYSHYNISHANIKGEIDLLVDNNLFEIKTSQYEIATTSNITQLLLYGYLAQKKDKKINNIILYNPLNGYITKFNVEDINFKEVANVIYDIFKTK